MKLIILVCSFIFFVSGSVIAEDLSIKNVHIRSAIEDGYLTTLYLSIENKSNEIDYLIGAEIIDYPDLVVSVNKTVIEKTIVRIINIDRLAIPPKTTVTLAPLGIYIVIKKLPLKVLKSRPLEMRFFFKNKGIVLQKISL